MIDFTRATIEVRDDPEALARRGADWLVERFLARAGRIAVALSGGSTPRPIYALLAAPPRAAAVPWPRIHWFWGDERFVPHDHPESNFRMVREALLSRAPVPPANIHPVPTEHVAPDEAAARYEEELRAFHGGDLDAAHPLFDVTLLGIGPDGHTASLFPGDAALGETRRWVVAVPGGTPPPRISLTLPALDASRDILFLAAGAGKRAALARLFAGDRDLPVARLSPAGRVHLLLDRAAAPDRRP